MRSEFVVKTPASTQPAATVAGTAGAVSSTPLNLVPLSNWISFRRFHPNIYNNGQICLDILQNQWSPIYDICAILTSIQSLLCDPNPASPANSEVTCRICTRVGFCWCSSVVRVPRGV